MTYVDFKNKVVFNGSDLGKEYSAKGVIEGWLKESYKSKMFGWFKDQDHQFVIAGQNEEANIAGEKEKNSALEKTIELLMGPAKNDSYVPSQLIRKKSKRKRWSLHL